MLKGKCEKNIEQCGSKAKELLLKIKDLSYKILITEISYVQNKKNLISEMLENKIIFMRK